MPRAIVLLMLSCLSVGALAAGPGQPGGPGEVMGDMPSACPPGWLLQGKVKANGAFTCRLGKGMQAADPAPALSCPANTAYFVKGRQLGCAAVANKPHSAKRKKP